MANSLSYKANIWLGKYILYQETVILDAGNTSDTAIVITLPNGYNLKISKAGVAACTKTITAWNTDANAADWSNIKKDLKRWGWDTTPESGTYLCMIDLDLLTNSAYYPGGSLTQYFDYEKASGIDASFPNVDVVSDGVYKFVSTVGVYDITSSPVEDLVETRRILSFAVSDQGLATKIDDYFDKHADESIPLVTINTLRDLTMKLLMLQYSARYDFSRNSYTEANEKAVALESAISTGVFPYKSGV